MGSSVYLNLVIFSSNPGELQGMWSENKISNLILGTWENILKRNIYNNIVLNFVQMLSRQI